jgi:YidC/Oxa1 family membrane protein insertase
MQDNKNFFLAIALSMIVLVGWNVFFGLPTAEKARKEAQMQTQVANGQPAGQPAGQAGAPAGSTATAIPDLGLPGAPAARRRWPRAPASPSTAPASAVRSRSRAVTSTTSR